MPPPRENPGSATELIRLNIQVELAYTSNIVRESYQFPFVPHFPLPLGRHNEVYLGLG